MIPDRPPRLRPAFTIVELLVAMTITVVMIGMVVEITTNVLNIWTKTSGTLDTENQAALIFDFIAKDFHGLTQRRDARNWWAVTVQNDQNGTGDAGMTLLPTAGGSPVSIESWTTSGGIMKPGQGGAGTTPSSLNLPAYVAPTTATAQLTASNNLSLTNLPTAPFTYRFGQAGVWLRMITTQADNNPPPGANATPSVYSPPFAQNDSVPRAVSYQIARVQLTKSGGYHYYLFRSAVRPWASAIDSTVTSVTSSQAFSTFDAGYDFFYNFVGGLHTTVASSYSSPTSGGTSLADASTIRRPNIQQVLANNVVDFGIRVWGVTYDANHNPMSILLFPISQTNLGFSATTEDGFTRTLDPNNNPIPASQPPAISGWSGTPANMTYAFAFKAKNGGGMGTPDTPCTPAFVDVFVRILDDEGSRLINLIETGQLQPPGGISAGDFWWQTCEAHSKVYARRIDLIASPM